MALRALTAPVFMFGIYRSWLADSCNVGHSTKTASGHKQSFKHIPGMSTRAGSSEQSFNASTKAASIQLDAFFDFNPLRWVIDYLLNIS